MAKLVIAVTGKQGGTYQYEITATYKTATGISKVRTHRLAKSTDAIKAVKALAGKFHFQNRRRIPTAPALKTAKEG